MISGWTSHAGPRRSNDHGSRHKANKSDDEDSPRRRSSSDATPRQTAPDLYFLSTHTSAQDQNQNVGPNSASPIDSSASSRRLGFFTDKLSSTSASRDQRTAQLLHPPQSSHSRQESSSTQSLSPLGASTMSSSSTLTNSKGHISPSKASYGRTYDSKLVSREMHRLGGLAHLPSALTPTLGAASTSAASLPLPASSMSNTSIASSSSGDPWGALHVHVLPLFNGEPLRIPIEDLNILVRRHIQSVVSASPSKALATLEHDASELIASGMVTLNAKLKDIEDEKLIGRVVEIWGFFWDQVLTYIEGVLLPFQTDPLLSSLYRTPKPHRPTSPTRQNSNASSLNSISTYRIDVRTVALLSFRDKIILPLSTRLRTRLSTLNKEDSFSETSAYQQPRLQQMLLVLGSQSRQRPPAFSLTAPAPQPTPSEAAIAELLRVVRAPQISADVLRGQPSKPLNAQSLQAPTFLSGGLPRDRRGRIAQKQKGKSRSSSVDGETAGEDDDVFGDGGDGAETPRGEYGVVDVDSVQFLESLRSPDLESSAARASVGGWGLGGGNEDSAKVVEEDDDDPLDWDQAQAVVERMVGMEPSKDPPPAPAESRRRMT